MVSRVHTSLRRRDFLRIAMAGAGASVLAACAPSPLIESAPRATETPVLDDARRQAAQAAADLEASALASAALGDADADFASWCQALAAQHHTHLTLLCQADPLGGVLADPTPVEQVQAGDLAEPADQAEAMTMLAEQEGSFATMISTLPATAAGQDSDPDEASSMALLWVSQWLAANIAGSVLGSGDSGSLGAAPVAGDAVPARAEMGDLAASRQVLLSRQRALVFGLQGLYGRVDYADPTADKLYQRLGDAMKERDATAAELTASGVTPDAPLPEYTLPGDITDASQTNQIWGSLEAAVMAGWARIAAVDAGERTEASQQALAQAGRARDLGIALSYWPGWV
ncbi:DUF4439 domain-containing protein [Propionimicrobium sp. PCR01-08-3]|uniref:DUF4439 domain-containing protein n=1 Tax=Propionimicrobium sp. PCR01-08-3 TaxID=3052086 RepID=UPI00255C43B3|nr:DUF4439 domain-containing protein [Propionimicrobium sp. PCR01-08-3]WIY81583.1 DUF4439 domain-containing protein [Propionimicrobium sp. PCR01-08-3]